MSDRALFVEEAIIGAAKGLLTGRVNEILNEAQFIVPVIEFGNFGGGYAVAPAISLTGCERTEKERIIQLDSYTLTISFTFSESPESELHCYAYSSAVGLAVSENPTLGDVVDRTAITAKKYISPKKPHCGEAWGLVLILRIAIGGIGNAG